MPAGFDVFLWASFANLSLNSPPGGETEKEEVTEKEKEAKAPGRDLGIRVYLELQ